jgi:adenylate cyclase
LQQSLTALIESEGNRFVLRAFSALNALAEQLRVHAMAGRFAIVDTDAPKMRVLMLPQAREYFPNLYIGFAPSGYFAGFANTTFLGLNASSTFVLTETLAGTGTRGRYSIGETGDPLGAPIGGTVASFNSTQRPWFQACVQAQASLFTGAYSFTSTRSLGITATVPLFEDLQAPPFFSVGAPAGVAPANITGPRRVVAVVAADYSLGFLNEFLAGLQIGVTGEAFVLDNAGFFIASSQAARIGAGFTISYTHSTLINDGLVNSTMQALLWFNQTVPINRNNYSDYARLGHARGFPVVGPDGRRYRVTATPNPVMLWEIVVLIPDSDYSDAASHALLVSLYVALGFVVLATIGFTFFGILVTRPINLIARRMEQITTGLDFDDLSSTSDGRVPFFQLSEIDSMLESFSRLRLGLQSFSRYVPLAVVRTLMESNSSAVLGVENCVASVFFSDIEGFTTVSETVEPPVLIALLDEYFTEMSEIIMETHGMVIDYFGDAILASWNAPLIVEGHEVRAVRSALLQQRALSRLRGSWAERGMPQLRVRMGLTVGSPLAGNVGSKYRMKYTLMGDSVNCAARLEELNKHYGTYVMITQDLHSCVAPHFVCRLLDLVSVAGKGEAMQVYEVLTERTGPHPGDYEASMLRLEAQSHEAFSAFRRRDWAAARALYRAIGGMQCELFLARIDELEKHPPGDDWTGLTSWTIK